MYVCIYIHTHTYTYYMSVPYIDIHTYIHMLQGGTAEGDEESSAAGQKRKYDGWKATAYGYVFMYACVFMREYMCMCVYDACLYLCVHLCVCVYIYTHTHIYMHVFICTYMNYEGWKVPPWVHA